MASTANTRRPRTPDGADGGAGPRGQGWETATTWAVLAAVAAVPLVSAVLLLWPTTWWFDPPGRTACPAAPSPTEPSRVPGGGSGADAVVERVPLELSAADQVLRLGRSRSVRALTATLSPGGADSQAALPDGTVLAVTTRPFVRADGADIPEEAIVASARVVGGQVDVTLCVVPERGSPAGAVLRTGRADPVGQPVVSTAAASAVAGHDAVLDAWVLQPGTYAGSVVVTDSRVSATTVPFTVTRSFPRWWSVLGLAALASAGGVVWLYFLRTGENVDANERFQLLSGEFVRWLRKRGTVISIATGSVGAAAVYSSTYLRSEEWGASATVFLSFIGAVFTAFVTTATAGKLAENSGQARGAGTGGTAAGRQR